jgi:hypothetical protein
MKQFAAVQAAGKEKEIRADRSGSSRKRSARSLT